MNRKTYKPSDFNEWTIVQRQGIMSLPGSPSVSDWLEAEYNAGRVEKKPYPLSSQFKMYNNHSFFIFRNSRPDNEQQMDICQFCGRFEPCTDNWGNMFCADTPTCNAYHLMSKGRYSLVRNLPHDFEWTIELLKQCNLSRLPDMWKTWAERQIDLDKYRKGEL
jgi:hypothetical protein